MRAGTVPPPFDQNGFQDAALEELRGIRQVLNRIARAM
jgi:hypothetical protein